MSDPLVWLPFDPAELGAGLPTTLRYEQVDPREHVPDSVEDVAFFVAPYGMDPNVADAVPRMRSLQVLQVLSAGVDNVRGIVPEGVTLCNGRGIHDTSTAELALTLTLAGMNDVPGMVRDQQRHHWGTRWRTALADRRVVLVGYGSIGGAIEARLAPFEVEVVRVARTARDTEAGHVHAFTELPGLVADADVVILICPLTDETRGLVDADLLARMPDGALLVNMARGPVVDTDALVAELRAGRLRAAVDVLPTEPLPADSELWDLENLLISPHVGGASTAMWPRAYRLVRAQLERFAAGEPLAGVMDGAY
ncbi:2-hydroxyacid dehydrogenase [Nocardioides sp. GY 10127]|uniref:2-hydroxyacid dehydrogenase n=1 Tax=Nocardioides sp. GY 10127 TaxID=2569762 RepID=UPI0010A87FFD|nr:2-hydroxyacid dehydrogenase [Nocardioides sp. GY 10127]TIC83951.1 dihydrofolate reductase [Nocardioides sp. GY 10127]